MFKALVAQFVCLVAYSGKNMCGKMICKVQPLISQDYFSAEILYLVKKNSLKYNVSLNFLNLSVCESKEKRKE